MKLFIILILSFHLLSCDLLNKGTNTGNPEAPAYTQPNIDLSPITVLGITLCSKIKSCLNLADNSLCANQVLQADLFTSELNLNPPYLTLQEAQTAIDEGSLSLNTDQVQQCLNTIDGLECHDPLINQSYSSSYPEDFTQLFYLFRAHSSCQNIKN